MQIEDLSQDILDISEMFVSKLLVNTETSASDIIALRQATIEQVTGYLADDSLCGYEASKRLLLQTWNDHYPAPVEEDQNKSVWNAVVRYSNTEQFTTVHRAIDVTGNNTHKNAKLTLDWQNLIRVITAYCAHFQTHGNFNTFKFKDYLLCGGNLSDEADMANNIVLQQVAIHILMRNKKTLSPENVKVDNPQAHISEIVSSARAARSALVNGLSQQMVLPAVAQSPDTSGLGEYDLGRKKTTP